MAFSDDGYSPPPTMVEKPASALSKEEADLCLVDRLFIYRTVVLWLHFFAEWLLFHQSRGLFDLG